MVLPLNGDDNGTHIQTDIEQVNYNIVTLTRFLTEEQIKHKEATGDFTYVLLSPATSSNG